MSIGAFARRTRLSGKALRLYDAMGLLPPARVDEASGYRWYAPEQVARARLIGLFRRLEMPLAHIARILDLSGAEAARAVTAYWRDVETDVRSKRRLVRYLEDHLVGKVETMYEIRTRHVPERKVATIEGHVDAKGLPGFIGRTMHALLRHLDAAGITPSDAPFVVYHGLVDTDSDGPVETCVPFAGAVEPRDDVRIRIEPAHDEAFTTLTKGGVAYPEILEAYDAVARHLRERGLETAAPPREVYFAAWDAIGDGDPACDVAFPYGA